MVKVADRFGKITEEETIQDRFLRRMYGNMAGRFMIRALVRPGISEIGGKLLESKASALAVRPFVKKNQIDLSQCTKQSFDSYNDFLPESCDRKRVRYAADRKRLSVPVMEDLLSMRYGKTVVLRLSIQDIM